MRKLLCPQCKIAGLYVKNEKKERLLVYVSDEGEVVPRNLEENMEGFVDSDVALSNLKSGAVVNYILIGELF